MFQDCLERLSRINRASTGSGNCRSGVKQDDILQDVITLIRNISFYTMLHRKWTSKFCFYIKYIYFQKDMANFTNTPYYSIYIDFKHLKRRSYPLNWANNVSFSNTISVKEEKNTPQGRKNQTYHIYQQLVVHKTDTVENRSF